MGEFYTYLPPFTTPGYEANEAQCHVPPYSECNPEYGNSIGRGAFNFTGGERGTVAMRVLLNDPGVANGELELWYNGESVIELGGLIIRDSAEGRIRGLMMETFFGGKWRRPASRPEALQSDIDLDYGQVATPLGPPLRTNTPTSPTSPSPSPRNWTIASPTVPPGMILGSTPTSTSVLEEATNLSGASTCGTNRSMSDIRRHVTHAPCTHPRRSPRDWCMMATPSLEGYHIIYRCYLFRFGLSFPRAHVRMQARWKTREINLSDSAPYS